MSAELQAVLDRLDELEARLAKPVEPARVVPMQEAARLLSVGLTTMKGLAKSEQLRTVMIGGRRMVPRSEIERVATPPPARDRRGTRPRTSRSQIQDPDALLRREPVKKPKR